MDVIGIVQSVLQDWGPAVTIPALVYIMLKVRDIKAEIGRLDDLERRNRSDIQTLHESILKNGGHDDG